MSTLLFANNAQTTLAGPISAGALSVNLAAGTGSEFANPGIGQYFVLTFTDAATGLLHEIVSVTARVGDTLTVVRAQEGTTARSWSAGDIAGNWWTAGSAATMVQVQALQTQPGNFSVDTGTVNNIQISLNPAPATLTTIAGAPIRVMVKNTNTGPTTLTIAGLASTIVFAQSGSTSSLPANSVTAGQIFEFIYMPSLGFQVATAKVLLSTSNAWALSQVMANNSWWSGFNTTGGAAPLLGVDTSNNTTMWAGPSGSIAWRVLNSLGTGTLMYLGAAGTLHAVGGITADTGDLTTTTGNISSTTGAVLGVSVQAGSSGITSAAGSTGTQNQNRVPILADFAGGSGPNGIWFSMPSFGLTASDTVIVQIGSIGVPGVGVNLQYSLPRGFPVNFEGIVISFGSNVPPVTGAVGAQPFSLSSFTATNTSGNAQTNGCYFIAIGW